MMAEPTLLPVKMQRNRRYSNKFKHDVVTWHFRQRKISVHATSHEFNVDRKSIKLWISQREQIEKLEKGRV